MFGILSGRYRGSVASDFALQSFAGQAVAVERLRETTYVIARFPAKTARTFTSWIGSSVGRAVAS